jgi:hypothetical protein
MSNHPDRPSGCTSRRLGRRYDRVPAVLQRHPDFHGRSAFPGVVVYEAVRSA